MTYVYLCGFVGKPKQYRFRWHLSACFFAWMQEGRWANIVIERLHVA